MDSLRRFLDLDPKKPLNKLNALIFIKNVELDTVTKRLMIHGEAMQIVSGPVYDPHIHFEAPPFVAVPSEMAEFVA